VDKLEAETPDIRVQLDPDRGEVFLRARMPLHRGEDYLIVEFGYQDLADRPVTRRVAIRLTPSARDRRLSEWERWVIPTPEDHASPHIRLRVRSRSDGDLYLLAPEDQRNLLAYEPALSLVARPAAGGCEFSARWQSQRAMIADPEVCWHMQVAKTDEEGSHDEA
jgi:hypothetical protein